MACWLPKECFKYPQLGYVLILGVKWPSRRFHLRTCVRVSMKERDKRNSDWFPCHLRRWLTLPQRTWITFNPITSLLPHNNLKWHFIPFYKWVIWGSEECSPCKMGMISSLFCLPQASGSDMDTEYPLRNSFPGISSGSFWKDRFLVTLGLGVTRTLPLPCC